MTNPQTLEFIKHHVDTHQVGILSQPMPYGLGEICLYTFQNKLINHTPDLLFTMEPKAGPQFASLVINTVTDWLKAHWADLHRNNDAIHDTVYKAVVDVDGIVMAGGAMRVQLIEVDYNDAQQFTDAWARYERGPNYMDKMANFGTRLLIQLPDAQNRLPGEDGFDEECRDCNFVYADKTEYDDPVSKGLMEIVHKLEVTLGMIHDPDGQVDVSDMMPALINEVIAWQHKSQAVMVLPHYLRRLQEAAAHPEFNLDGWMALYNRTTEMMSRIAGCAWSPAKIEQ